MYGPVGLLAVQVSNPHAHPITPGRSGALGMAVLAIGLGLICYGALPIVRLRRWRALAVQARGRVVDNVPRPSGRRKTRWLPLIEFEADGVTVMSAIPAAATRRGWPLGYAVDVLYDPSNPQSADLADAGRRVSSWLILGVFMVVMFLAVVT